MATFPQFHGISLAPNSYIENFVLEPLATDPVPLTAGLVWYNTTDKRIKFTSVNASGAAVVVTLSDLSDNAKVASDAKAYTDAQVAALIDGAPAVLDTLKELATALGNDPDLSTNLLTKIGENKTAIEAEVARATAAEQALDTRITTVEGQVNGNIGDLADLVTTDKSTLVGAINSENTERKADVAQLNSDLTAETTARGVDTKAIRDDLKALNFTYESATASLTHTITHNLNAQFIHPTVLIQRSDGKYYGDLAMTREVDANTFEIVLSDARKVKVALTKVDPVGMFNAI